MIPSSRPEGNLYLSCAVRSRLQWRSAVVRGAARTLLRHLVDAAGTHSQRWTPRRTPSSVWQALLTPEVVPMLAEVLRAWCWLSLVLTLLSPGVLPLPVLGRPSSGGISVPSADPREHGFVLLYPGSVSFFHVMQYFSSFLLFIYFFIPPSPPGCQSIPLVSAVTQMNVV